jgi:hypothetical protein
MRRYAGLAGPMQVQCRTATAMSVRCRPQLYGANDKLHVKVPTPAKNGMSLYAQTCYQERPK